MKEIKYSDSKDETDALSYLQRHFDIARLVNPIITRPIDCEYEKGDGCYSVWGKNERCRNCVSSRVLITGEPSHKFERIGDDIYLVTSERVVTPKGPRVLELVSRMEHRFEKHYALQQADFSTIEELAVMAYQDSLTGVFNRAYAEENLNRLIDKVAETGEDLMIALLDIDNLKTANDTYGHLAGDALIKSVVVQALSAIPFNNEEEGFFARTGGDEFVLVVRTEKGMESSLLQKVLDSIAQGSLPDYPEIPVSASIGAVMLSECEDTSLIGIATIADRRLYYAKRSGRKSFALGDTPSFDPPEPKPEEKRLYRRDEPFCPE